MEDILIITKGYAKKYKGVDLILMSLIRQSGSFTLKQAEDWSNSTRQGIYKSAKKLGIKYENAIFTLK